MNKKLCFMLCAITIIVLLIGLVIYKKKPSFSEYINYNDEEYAYTEDGKFAIYSEDITNDNIVLVIKYFSSMEIKGNIYELEYLDVEDNNCTQTVSSNINFGDIYYLLVDSNTNKEYEVVVVDGEVLYEELVY